MKLTKTISLLSALALLATVGLACGSNSSGPSCTSVCKKMVECDIGETQVGCEADCAEMKVVLDSAVFNALGDCMMDLTCSQFENDGAEICMVTAALKGDPTAADDMVTSMCVKIVSCDSSGVMTQEACELEMKANAGDALEMMGMFKTSVISCVETCYSDSDCAELDVAIDDCFATCGIDFGSDDLTDNGGTQG